MQKATKFRVNVHTGEVVGPAAYLASDHYRCTKRKIEDGTHVLIGAFPPNTPIGTMIEVILQTDYAAWKGARQLAQGLAFRE